MERAIADLPDIQWPYFCGIDQVNQSLVDTFVNLLDDNPASSVVDLEEGDIQINRFARRLGGLHLVYLEVDSRIAESLEQAEVIFDCAKGYSYPEESMKEFRYFARIMFISNHV